MIESDDGFGSNGFDLRDFQDDQGATITEFLVTLASAFCAKDFKEPFKCCLADSVCQKGYPPFFYLKNLAESVNLTPEKFHPHGLKVFLLALNKV